MIVVRTCGRGLAVVMGLALLSGACGGETAAPVDAAVDGVGGDAEGRDAGVDRPIYRSHESQYCSATDDDDPHYECSLAERLICINTYAKTYPLPEGPKTVAMYLCRTPCELGASDCLNGDICCPGSVHGVSYGKSHACVAPEFCDQPAADAGARF